MIKEYGKENNDSAEVNYTGQQRNNFAGFNSRLSSEDLIDLASLVSVLYRKKWLILAGTLLFTLLASVQTMLLPQKYAINSILEVGKLQKEGQYSYIESPEGTAERLNGLAKMLIRKPEFKEKPAFSTQEDLVFKPSDKGGIVELNLNTPDNEIGIKFLNSLQENLLKDHARIIDIQKQVLKSKIENLDRKIQEQKAKIASYNRRLQALDKEEAFLQEEKQRAFEQLEQIISLKSQASFNPEKEPLGQLLFGNEVQRIQSNISELRERLISGLPQERENLLMYLQEVESKMQSLQNELENNEVNLENIISTNILLSPSSSETPISPPFKRNIALGFLIGLFLFVLLSFLMEFWQNNKEKITSS